MANQVEVTVLKIGTSALYVTPQSWSFPSDEIALEDISDGDINCKITWNNTLYYVSETYTDIVAQANSGGGGGVESVTGNLVNNTDPLNPVVSLPYRAYIAILSQNTTNNPVATVLNSTAANYLGALTWIRGAEGEYSATSTGLFPIAKTFILSNQSEVAAGIIRTDVANGGGNSVILIQRKLDGTEAGVDTFVGFFIEIRVYP